MVVVVVVVGVVEGVFCCRVLAVDLRQKLGDWFRVVQLLKSGGGAGACGFCSALSPDESGCVCLQETTVC